MQFFLHKLPLSCRCALCGWHAGVGNLMWDILANLGQSAKDNDPDDIPGCYWVTLE